MKREARQVHSRDRRARAALPIHHVGVDLWRAAIAWREGFAAEMVRRGHAWYGDARGAIAMHLDPAGLPQGELVARMRLSKQAVQQLLDGLAADGIVDRRADDGDRRAKWVYYTDKGLAAQREAAKVKRRMEARLLARVGAERLEVMRECLRAAADVFGAR